MWLMPSPANNTFIKFNNLPEILKRPHESESLKTPQQQFITLEQQDGSSSAALEHKKRITLKPKLPTIINFKPIRKNVSPTHSQPPIKPRTDTILKPKNHSITPMPHTTTLDIQSETDKLKNKAQMILNKKKYIDEYEIKEIIGQGAYATVRKGVHRDNDIFVAIKMYDKDRLYDPQRARGVAREIKLLRKCEHKNIIKLVKIVENKKYLNLILEYGGETSLRQQKPLNINDIRYIFKQLIQAVAYLHSNKIVHRDIKMENILINKNKEIKLIDFGFASEFDTNYFNMAYGTPSYMSPEMYMQKYNEKTDIWSCGILLYVLLFNKFPFVGHHEKELQSKIRKQEIQYPKNIEQQVQKVLDGCLDRDSINRKSASQLLEMDWIKYNI